MWRFTDHDKFCAIQMYVENLAGILAKEEFEDLDAYIMKTVSWVYNHHCSMMKVLISSTA